MSTGKTYSTKYLQDSKNNRGSEGQILSSTSSGIDWVTLSEISGVDGTGTANYLSKWLDANTITNSLVYDNGTNVGIGTTNPTYKLETIGSGYFGGLLRTKNTGDSSEVNLIPSGGSPYIQFLRGGSIDWKIKSSGNGSSQILDTSIGGTSVMTVQADGNVGIGTNNPAGILEVAGNTDTDSNFLIIRDKDPTSGSARPSIRFTKLDGTVLGQLLALDGTNQRLQFSGNATQDPHLTVYNNGNVGIGIATPSAKLEVAASATTSVDIAHFSNSNGAVKINHSLDAVGSGKISVLDASNNEDIRLSAQGDSWFNAGNVGIGTTSPTAKLDVVGTGTQLGSTGYYHNTRIKDTTNSGVLFGGNATNNGVGLIAGINELAFVTYGTGWGERMRINGSGNVGIGTTSPSAKLQVYSSTATRDIFISGHGTSAQNNWAGEHAFFVNAGNGIIVGKANANNDTNRLYTFYNDAQGNAEQYIYNTSNLATIKLDSAGDTYFNGGNVGIGTNSPTAPLDVLGVRAGRDWSIANRATIRLDANGTGFPSDILFGHTAAANQTSWTGAYWSLSSRGSGAGDKFYFYRASGNASNPSEAVIMTFDPDLNVGIGATNPENRLHISTSTTDTSSQLMVQNGSSGDAAIKFNISGQSNVIGIDNSDGNKFKISGFSALGTYDRLTIDTSGNVGIGITGPSYKLDVGGTFHVSNNSQLDGNLTVGLINSSPNFIVNTPTLNASFPSYLRVDGAYTSSISEVNIKAVGVISGGPYGSRLKFFTSNQATLSEKMRINPDGNVGIGTTGPSAPLSFGKSVYGSPTSENFFRIKFKDNGGITNDVGIGQSDQNSLDFNKTPSGIFSFNDGTNGEVMRIDSAGNVGIGTSPSDRLHVKNNDASGSNTRCDIRLENGLGYAEFGVLSGYARIQANGVEAAALSGGTSLFYGTQWLFGSNLTTGNDDGKLTINAGSGASGEAYLNLSRNGVSGFILNHSATAIQVRATANIPMFFYTNNTIGIKLNANSTVGFPEYGAGTLVTDASGNITASSGGGAGGPYLPLAGGTMTGPINIPSYIIHDGNTDAYFGFTTTNIFKVVTGGTNKFASDVDAAYMYYQGSKKLETTSTGVTVTGNVGIGTTSPASSNKLEVNGQVRVVGAQMIGNSATSNVVTTGVQLHIKNTGEAKIRLEDSDSSNLAFDILVNEGSGFSIKETVGGDSGDDTRLFIQETSGNVGIGTVSPSTALDVIGVITADGGTSTEWNTSYDNSIISLAVGGTTTKTLTATQQDGGTLTASWTDDNAGGTVTGTGAVNQVAFWNGTNTIDGTNNLYWDSTNNHLGINDNTPSSPLKVTSGTTETSIYTVDINHVRNNTDIATKAVRINMDLSGADTTTADRVNSALFIDIDSSANGDASNEHRIYGVYSDLKFSGFTDIARAGYFYAESNYTGAKTAQLAGIQAFAAHDTNSTSGGVSNMYGVYGVSSIQDLGDVDNAFGGYFSVTITTSRGAANIGVTKGVEGEILIDKNTTINYGTMIGVSSIIDNNEGTVPNFGAQYLFKGDYQGTKGANAYGVYVEGDKHYFEGKVGIGTTSPIAALQVGSITTTAMSQVIGKARIVGTNYTPSSTQMGTLDIASTTKTSSAPFNQGFGPSLTFSQNISGYVDGYEVVIGAIKSIVTSGSNMGQESAMTFLVNGGTSTGVVERMRIAEDGKVGIGTTNPAEKLHVVGRARFDDTQINAKGVYADYFSSGQSLTLNSGASASILFKIGNTTALTLDSSTNATFAGNVTIGSVDTPVGKGLNIGNESPTIQLFDTTNNAKLLLYSQDSSSVIGTYSNHALAFFTNSTQALNLDTSQNATFAGNVTVSGGDITLGGTGRIQGIDTVSASTDAANKAYVDAQVGSADTLQEVTNNGNTTTNSIAIGTTSVTALLNIATPSSTNVKVTKIAGDTTTVYQYATLADAVLEWTCGSYHNAEVVITASQTNSGTYNNLYIRGIWSNNHTSHHWDELEHIGGLTGTTFTITNGQNGSTTASGRLTLDVDYTSGSFATLNIRITDFFGTHAYTIT